MTSCRSYTHDMCQEAPALCMKVLTVTTAGDNLFIEATAENLAGALVKLHPRNLVALVGA